MATRQLATACLAIWAVAILTACAGSQHAPDTRQTPHADPHANEAPAAAPIDATRVFVPGPWERLLNVHRPGSQRVLEQERRTASPVGPDGRWYVRFERTPYARTHWTLERTLTMTRTADGIALLRFQDATRDLAYDFDPPLLLAPNSILGPSRATANAITAREQGKPEEVGEATATITHLAQADGLPRVQTTLTLLHGRSRVERSSELTLGDRGSIRERNERTVRWGPIRVDRSSELLEDVRP